MNARARIAVIFGRTTDPAATRVACSDASGSSASPGRNLTSASLIAAAMIFIALALPAIATAASAPTIQYLDKAPAREITDTAATIQAFVRPNEAALEQCLFEWGTDSSYGHAAPCDLQPEIEPNRQMAAAHVTGLDSESKYHFRLVATNAVGTTTAADREFTTFSTAPADPTSCPNDNFRTGLQQLLPDCRAWELVTPLDKNGADIAAEASSHVSSAEGDSLAYQSRGGFVDTVGSGNFGMTEYVAERQADGWSSHSITPTPAANSFQVLLAPTIFHLFSEDLESVVGTALDLPAAPDDTPGEVNLYRMATADRSLETITSPADFYEQPIFAHFVGLYQTVGASSDSKLISFTSPARLLDSARPGVPNVYEWQDGSLRLAGILPDGTAPEQGSEPPRDPSALAETFRGTVAPDGSAVAFVSPPFGGQVYLRRHHSNTVWISEPEGSFSGTPADVLFRGFSPDGKQAFFTTTSPLLNEDEDGAADLYRYTDGPAPASEQNLTLISSGEGTTASSVVGTSSDGSVVYYYSAGHLRRWESGMDQDLFGVTETGLSVNSEGPGLSRVSPDGSRLAFITVPGGGTPYALTGQDVGVENAQLYVYDSDSELLNCVSCPEEGSGGSYVASWVPDATEATAAVGFPGSRPRFLTSDGSRVFFSTNAPLDPEDTNGVSDAYEYEVETGAVHLLSSGVGEAGSWVVESDRDGSDVFIATRNHFASTDGDKLVDVYDARIDGGFPEPPPSPAPCEGATCQASAPAPPPVVAPGSGNYTGKGDPAPRRCRKRGVSRHRGHARCRKRSRKRHPHGRDRRTPNSDFRRTR